MSRLRKLKEVKRRKFIESTICSLALSVFIGSAQSITTYAWFKDNESIDSILVAQMGDVEVDIEDGFDKKVNIGNESEYKFIHPFDIENTGTLKQKLRLDFDCSNKYIAEKLKYTLTFEEYKGKKIESINGKLSDLLSNGELLIKYTDGKLVEVDAIEDNIIKATLNVEIDEALKNECESVDIDLNVIASQINSKGTSEEIGFTDTVTQRSTLTTNKKVELLSNIDVEFDNDDNDGDDEIEIFMPDNYSNMKLTDVSILGGEGEFSNIRLDGIEKENGKYKFEIEKRPEGQCFNKENIGKEFDRQKFRAKLVFKKGNKIINETWEIKFRMNGKELEGHYTVIETYSEDLEQEVVPEIPGVEGPENSTNPGIKPTPPIEKPEGPGAPEIEGPEGSTNPGIRPTPPVVHPGESEIDPVPPIEQETPEITEPIQPEIEEEPKEEVEA